MGIFDSIRNWFLSPLLSELEMSRIKTVEQARAYRHGDQRRQLIVKPGQFDDNLVLNFTGLATDRSVSLLFGKGVKVALDAGDDSPEATYLKAVYDANKIQILLHREALMGAEQGTCYLKTIPDGVVGQDDKLYPRLVAVDPAWVTMDTDPEDFEQVIRYTIKYTFTAPDGKARIRKQEIAHVAPTVNADGTQEGADHWTVEDFVSNDQGNFDQVGATQEWAYPFPPMLHWQNLPAADSVYGEPDITADVIELQDRVNFLASNISKLVRLYAHPQRWSRFGGIQNKIEVGPSEMPNFEHEQGGIWQLEPLGDLASAVAFFLNTRQSLMDITRTVDITSMADKLGALTNFGLRVLYQDAMQKLATKRELYGDALVELNHRLLVLAGLPDTDGGKIDWPEPLPVNETEAATQDETEQRMGIVSKETLAGKRGYDWSVESARIQGEKAGDDNLGAALLDAFNRGA